MTRATVMVALLALGCQDVSLSPMDARVEVGPELLDLGHVWVGEEVTGGIQVDLVAGPPARVIRVDVVARDAEAFTVEVPPPEAEAVLDAPLVIPVLFRPEAAGWFSAQVTVASNAVQGPWVVEVRGHAAEPDLVATPLVLDFGRVPAGSVVRATSELTNLGDRTITVSEAWLDHAAFVLDDALPLVIGPGETVRVAVSCGAADDAPVHGALDLGVGARRVPGILALRANDCEGGLPERHDVDGDGVTWCAGDCDDGDVDVYPGALETPDGVDEDCDGQVDEGTRFTDDDGDGYCEATECVDGSRPGDCVDADAAIAPDLVEVDDNGIDDDCDGVVDRGGPDLDGDGFGPGGGDCDDGNAAVHPAAEERRDGVDQDCDHLVDEGTSAYDDDEDGFCEAGPCVGAATPGDCDDDDPTTSPASPEAPDGLDNDCDGVVDEGTTRGDDDGDGFTELGGDCDDADPRVNPARGGCS